MSKILVTGGAGFIGSNLVDALIENNHDVIVVDNLSTGSKSNLNSKAKFIELDLIEPRLVDVFTEHKPEMIFHLAAQIDVRKSVADPFCDAKQNILASINLLECCRKQRVKKIIFSSTGGAIYGDTDELPTQENHPEMPISPYGIAKLTVEKYLYYYNQVFGLPYVVLRYSNVYGPRQNSQGEAGVVAIFCGRLLIRQQPMIYGDGKQTRDYVYVSDVVQANLMALSSSRVGIYNIGTGLETSVNQLAELIKESFSLPVDFRYLDPRPGEQQKSCLDFSKAKAELGWQPKISLSEGIKKTVEWFNHK